MAADYSFKGQVPMSSIIESLSNKPVKEQAMKIAAEENRRARLNQFGAAVESGLKIAKDATALSVERMRQRAIKDMSEILARKDQPTTSAITQFKKEPAIGPATADGVGPTSLVPGQSVTPTFGQTPGYQSGLLSAAAKVNPDKAAESMFEQAFPKPLAGSATRPTPLGIELPDGTQTLGYFDPNDQKYHLQSGEVAPPGSKRSYKYDLKTDSEGNLLAVSGASGKTVSKVDTRAEAVPDDQVGTITDYNRLPAGERKEAIKAVTESSNDPSVKKEKEVLVGMNRLRQAVASRNPVIAQKLGLIFQRAMGDTGNIALAEQRAPGSAELIEQGKQIWNTYITTGALSPENEAQMLKALDVLESVASENYNALVDIETDKIVAAHPRLNQDWVRRKVGGNISAIKPKSAPGGADLGDGFSYEVTP